MSSKTTSPDVPSHGPSALETAAEAGTRQAPTGDELPFESPEFGVIGFLPHLDAPPSPDHVTDPSPPGPDLSPDPVAAQRPVVDGTRR